MSDQSGNGQSGRGLKLFKTEDYWAIWLGLGVILAALGTFWAGSTIKPWAVTPKTWKTVAELGGDLMKNAWGYVAIFAFFGAVFALSMKLMGQNVRRFLAGYSVLFVGALAIFVLAGSSVAKKWDLDAPLLALLIGLVIGNVKAMPEWLKAALRTEYYIKTGIVLLGATLPLTLIVEAGPIAFVQATIVAVTTWLVIYLAATRIFKLDPRFGAVLGTGGAVCGVSGSIAIGGAVKADKDHIAIGIAVVSVWAIVMILALAVLTKWLIPEAAAPTTWYQITPAQAGAWVGTSEYADAAGFAVVAELAARHGDAPIYAFTLMKVIGRDIWIGIWAFVLSIVSVAFWERSHDAGDDRPKGRVGIGVIWERFPKFVLGFLAASVIMSVVAARAPADYVGEAPWAGTFESKAQKQEYHADFRGYSAPESLATRFEVDPSKSVIRFRGKMTVDELRQLSAQANDQQKWALKTLQHKSDWFQSVLGSKVISPVKTLRSWAFVLCFLCIGLSTRFRELTTFGLKPFWAFTIGVLVNVPLGFLLTTQAFARFWRALG